MHRANGWDVAPAQYHRTPTAPQDARVVSGRVIGLDFEHLQFKSGYTAPDEEPGGERGTATRRAPWRTPGCAVGPTPAGDG